MHEVMTIAEVAELLRMNVQQVYGLLKTRTRARSEKPIPVLKVNGNVRFLRSSVTAWLREMEEA
jgi:predicted DNA-binding transcriptional regulator AlpA